MAATVTANASDEAQKLIDEMNKNSAAWGSSSADNQQKLHGQNVNLASTLGALGYQTSYDPNGAWTISGAESNVTAGKKDGAQAAEDYRASAAADSGSSGGLPSASSKESYINSYYTAAQQAAIDALDASYRQNVIDLDATAAKIPATYYTAKNEAAVQNAQGNQAFNEYAAASGLNSGAGGQAALASSNQLQSNLSGIAQQQANAVADIDTQRAKVKAQYQSAVAQAIADNDLQKASTLYEDMVRVEESMISTAQAQASLDTNADQTKYERDQAQEATAKEDAATAKADAKGRVDNYLAMGGNVASLDPALVAASGYTAAELAAQEAYYAKAAAATTKTTSSGGSSSGSGSGAQDYDNLFADALASGNPSSFISNNYKKYGFTSSTGLSSDYGTWAENKNAEETAANTLSENAEAMKYTLGAGKEDRRGNVTGPYTSVEIEEALITAYGNGTITENDFINLMDSFGIDWSKYAE
ncbi:MAG: hypothetical protein EOM54_13470 [Clostridia bacterium]|nr:hypothetical protein [Clostridia bacterium]